MLKLYIDADSCPVKQEALKVAARHDLFVFIVSNNWFPQKVDVKVQKILVSKDFDAADNWIFEHVEEDDIVVSSDILLAGRAIDKNAHVISPNGKIYNKDNIGMVVGMRNINTVLRDSGEINTYNPSFSQKDRSKFLQNLEEVIQKIKRG